MLNVFPAARKILTKCFSGVPFEQIHVHQMRAQGSPADPVLRPDDDSRLAVVSRPPDPVPPALQHFTGEEEDRESVDDTLHVPTQIRVEHVFVLKDVVADFVRQREAAPGRGVPPVDQRDARSLVDRHVCAIDMSPGRSSV